MSFAVGDGPVVEARCENISLGGMYIETDEPAPFGAAVRVLISFPGMKEPAEVEATVRWTKPGGMGIQFGVMGAKATHALTRLLASLSEPPPAG